MMTSQDTLWALPTSMGSVWWLLCAAMAFPAALTVFFKSVMNQRISAVTICKFLHVCSLIGISGIWLNSGWLPWTVALTALSGLLWACLPVLQWLRERGVARDTRRAYAAEQRRLGLSD